MPDTPVLLQIGNFTDRMEAALAPHFEILRLFESDDRAGLLASRGGEVVAVCTDGHWGIPEDVLAACPNIKAAASYGVGYDGIDVETAVARGIVISHTPDVLNDEVAATAILLWHAVARKLIPQEAWARSGRWETEGNAPLTRTVFGQRVGILGLGRIGLTIADLAKAYRAEIHYHTRSERDVPYTYHASAAALAW